MRGEVLKSIKNEEYKKFTEDLFNHGNNLNPKQRLEDIVNSHSNEELGPIIGDKNLFTDNIKDSRNYYTHYNRNKKKNVLEGEELFYLSERLKILLVCAILEEIGITKDLLEKSIKRVKRSLFNHLIKEQTSLNQ